MTKDEKLDQLHERALTRFDKIQSAVYEERRMCAEDRKFCFVAGAQYDGDWAKQFDNRPKFEINKIHKSVIRIESEYRNNRISTFFTPRKVSDDEVVDVVNGLYRADEQDSHAQDAYDNAFVEACSGGIGGWRLRTEYEDEYDEDNDHQRIKLEPIYDADTSIFFDLDSRKQDKSDAQYCYVLTGMSKESYAEKYDDNPDDWPKIERSQADWDWVEADLVYVAEYYEIEETSELWVYFEDVAGEKFKRKADEITEEDWTKYDAIGTDEVNRRRVKCRKVHKYILSGGKVLEDCGFIAGREIPIVQLFGKRVVIDGIERAMGQVRLAKDAQRLKNMQVSKLAELAAFSPQEKPIFAPEQMENNADMWSKDHIEDYPYLLADPITNEEGQVMHQGPLAYTKPPMIPPAMGALLQQTEMDIQDILGNQEVGEEMDTNISGKAVELIQNRLDMLTFIYMSNLEKAHQRSGVIWLSMAKDIYIEDDREMKVLDKEGEIEMIEIMADGYNDKGEPIKVRDISNSTFDVNVETGPSSSSKRSAMVRAFTGVATVATDPETKTVAELMSMMNLEGEGMKEIREFFRKKLVRIGAMEPTQEDLEEAAQQPNEPSPQDQYALSEAERAEAEAAKMRAQTVETIANAELKKAQAAEIMAEMNRPASPEAPAPEAPKNYDEERIYLEAKKAAAELELKEEELEIKRMEAEAKEKEQAVKLAEAMIKLAQTDDEKAQANQAREMVESDHRSAFKELANMLKEQNAKADEQRAKALEMLGKPKKIIRDGDKITGIE